MLENPGFSMFFRFCILPKTCLGDIFQEVHIHSSSLCRSSTRFPNATAYFPIIVPELINQIWKLRIIMHALIVKIIP